MLTSYFQNADVGMTKDAYYEMCEAMGIEPVEEQAPIEYQDFPPEVQQCFKFYYMLRDVWDPMGGSYLGKDMSTIFEVFRLYGLEQYEQIFAIEIIQAIDYERGSLIKAKQKIKEASSKKA
jgi:hypothetical protein